MGQFGTKAAGGFGGAEASEVAGWSAGMVMSGGDVLAGRPALASPPGRKFQFRFEILSEPVAASFLLLLAADH